MPKSALPLDLKVHDFYLLMVLEPQLHLRTHISHYEENWNRLDAALLQCFVQNSNRCDVEVSKVRQVVRDK